MLRHTHPLVKIRESVNPLIAVYKTSRFIVSLVFTGALIFCPIWQRLLLFLFTSCQTFCPVTRTIFLFFFSFKSQPFLLLRGFKKKGHGDTRRQIVGREIALLLQQQQRERARRRRRGEIGPAGITRPDDDNSTVGWNFLQRINANTL